MQWLCYDFFNGSNLIQNAKATRSEAMVDIRHIVQDTQFNVTGCVCGASMRVCIELRLHKFAVAVGCASHC